MTDAPVDKSLDSVTVTIEVQRPTIPENVSDWGRWHTDSVVMTASKRTMLSNFSNREVRAFYRRQNDFIDRLVALRTRKDARNPDLKTEQVGTPGVEAGDDDDSKPAARFAINISFASNIVLFVLKVIAAASSGSIAVIASVIDSALDLVSGTILYAAARMANLKDKHGYPIGKTRLEPVAVVIFAAVMSVAAVQLATESLQVLVHGFTVAPPVLAIDSFTFGIMGTVIAVKSALYLLCVRLQNVSASVEALASDHRNDVISNSVTIVTIGIVKAFPVAWAVDPACAIAVSVLILSTWASTGSELVKLLTGRVASPATLGELTFIALSHDARVKAVDTVRAYHVGTKILAEVDIVLPEDMPLRIAHDIGEALQHELERHPDVERAHVHLDYETAHSAEDEHTYPTP